MSADKINEQQQGRRRRAGGRPEVAQAAPADESVVSKGITAKKGYATPSRRKVEEEEEEGGNLVTRTGGGLRDYFEGVRSELGKVTWPTREETRRLTVVVIIALIAASIILGLISAAFTQLFAIGLNSPIVLLVFMVVAVGGGLIVNRINSRRNSSY